MSLVLPEEGLAFLATVDFLRASGSISERHLETILTAK